MTDTEPTTERGRAAGVWPAIHTQRAALAADLEELTDEQWATPSLCAGLTVREVLAHLTAGASLNTVRWLAGVIRCRFDFDKQVAVRLAEQLGADPAETLARFRHIVPSTTKPPLPAIAMLGETLVHGEDIRRPLGIRHAHPIDVITRVAEYYQGSDMVVVAKKLRRGAATRRQRRHVHDRLGTRGVRPHPGPGDGHDRTRGLLRRPGRRRGGHPARALREGLSPGHRAAAARDHPGGDEMTTTPDIRTGKDTT
ncbi:maleylpyruvate isomerase family mycothiol-dependent enzyme [Streptomyces sp. R1]|uniref:maleylpyruvate isomerase family mycothiol-dependent enzyme n=1 Tax=Streptomyces sp. R1 TaxID=1509279 RepID=UPI001E4E34C6|nr:maleylpyruvate isomerase family mycothiol-dependent enzyme [Streptomyces sp. R1]MCC8336977.1 maleylpyruvate isomerase family mycothiol-dependent enzyme [Streptomyces sp. R1]